MARKTLNFKSMKVVSRSQAFFLTRAKKKCLARQTRLQQKILHNTHLYLVVPLYTGCILMEEGISPSRKCLNIVSKPFITAEDIFVH